jgi:hypothetical protein
LLLSDDFRFSLVLEDTNLIASDIENVYLETIERYCKYKEPDMHRSEILGLLSTKGTKEEGKSNQ